MRLSYLGSPWPPLTSLLGFVWFGCSSLVGNTTTKQIAFVSNIFARACNNVPCAWRSMRGDKTPAHAIDAQKILPKLINVSYAWKSRMGDAIMEKQKASLVEKARKAKQRRDDGERMRSRSPMLKSLLQNGQENK